MNRDCAGQEGLKGSRSGVHAVVQIGRPARVPVGYESELLMSWPGGGDCIGIHHHLQESLSVIPQAPQLYLRRSPDHADFSPGAARLLFTTVGARSVPHFNRDNESLS
jgi:hypothetical protein